MQKKRSHPRAPTLLNATISVNGKAISCCVRELSSGGAKLRIGDVILPNEFQLVLKDTGEVRRAQVRWRRRTEIGIAFVKERRVFGRRAAPPGAEKH